MKNFSNEAKSKRRKAVAKVVLKRYSFIVWLPLLLYILNAVGSFFLSLEETYHAPKGLIGEIGYNIIIGVVVFVFVVGVIVSVVGMVFICLMIIGFIWDYLQRRTFLNDVRNIFCIIAKEIPKVGKAIVSAPKKLYQRIKDEKRRFNDAVERQVEKED